MLEQEQFTKGYTPIERSQVSSYLGNFNTADVEAFAQGLNGIYVTFGRLNLPEIELMLRDMRSDIHLFSLSMRGITGYVSVLPGGIRPCPYYLLLEGRGEKAALKRLEELGADSEKNFRRLSETGLLVPIQESLILQARRATLH
ncbi:MAG: hypothetical protein NUV73_03825 [Candidatus Daviesbacteria bacterium]|nr:hypothetical protein [Candidatus Daviesbacteria bacterium]